MIEQAQQLIERVEQETIPSFNKEEIIEVITTGSFAVPEATLFTNSQA